MTVREDPVSGKRISAIDPVAFDRLTIGEHRVLMLLARGDAPKQAAFRLNIKITTVRTHIASAKRKVGARTLRQLVAAYVAVYGAEPVATS